MEYESRLTARDFIHARGWVKNERLTPKKSIEKRDYRPSHLDFSTQNAKSIFFNEIDPKIFRVFCLLLYLDPL